MSQSIWQWPGSSRDLPPVWLGTVEPEREPPDLPLAWYAVYTRARHEKMVARELERRGVSTLLPLHRSVHRWKDRCKQVELPLFPSYVFVRTHPSRRLRILSAPGAIYLLSNGRGPLAISSSEIASVEIMAAAGLAEPCPFLRAGTRVRVVHGPLRGVEGILETRRKPGAVVVSINVLASSIRAEVPLEYLEPME